MRHARIFSLSVFLALLVYGALGYALLPLAFFEGDLTRLAMLPERLVRGTGALQVVEPPVEVPGFRMAMLWHERVHRDAAHQWLREQIIGATR